MRVLRPKAKAFFDMPSPIRDEEARLTGKKKSKVGFASLLLVGVLINPSDCENLHLT
jgi:hypothetical protein